MRREDPVQGSLFEEDYLVRTLGSIASVPDTALTELVANAWDAGATTVSITIPSTRGSDLIVEDDGAGMTEEEFKRRWMTLGYNRLKHQGNMADVVPGLPTRQRRAFGRNGVGRHGMLCFADQYEVVTRKSSLMARFVVAATSGREPFAIIEEEVTRGEGHGTRLRVRIARNRPDPDRIRKILSARFLHDPLFTVSVNGSSLTLTDHSGLIHQSTCELADGNSAQVFVIDSSQASKTAQPHGIAFWIGGRLVGDPSWNIGRQAIVDGRTSFAKRHTVVVQNDSMLDEIVPDWSGFRQSPVVESFFARVSEHISGVVTELSATRIRETTEAVLRQHKSDIEELRPLARLEISEFVTDIARANPMVAPENLAVALKAALRLEKSRNGTALLAKTDSAIGR